MFPDFHVSITPEEKNVLVEKLLTDQIVSVSDFGSIVIDILRKRQRVFNYATAFPAAEPACTTNFARTFIHQDWVDGESVVQAEQSVGEEGFNTRFHKIETDLDALGADVAQAFLCLAEMRSELRKLLDEIRAEINRINGDIFQCCQKPDRGAVFDPEIFTGAFLGVTDFAEGEFAVYKMNDRYTLIPRVNPPQVIDPADPIDDFRVRNVIDFTRVLNSNTEILQAFGDRPLTKEDLVTRFGDVEIRAGVKIKDVAPILPGGEYESLTALANKFTERSAIALDLSGGGEAIASFFGVGTVVGTVTEASVEKLSVVPKSATETLKTTGVETLGALADAEPGKLVSSLQAAGINVSLAEATAWVAAANTFRSIR